MRIPILTGALFLAAAAACSDTPSEPPPPPPVPSRLATTVTMPDSAITGATVATLSVTVTDAQGRTVSGAFVDFSVTAGEGRLASTRVASDAQGVAQVAWTAGLLPRTNTVRASLPAAPEAAVTFTTRAVMAPPMVTTRSNHTCALNTRGKAFCWGRGSAGALGNGTTADRTEPTPVAGGLAFWSIAAGGNHTCGVAMDLRAYCWGAAMEGQLGTTTSSIASPAPVVGNTRFVAVATGWTHTCALSTTGETWCWGRNLQGELGAPANVAVMGLPRRVESAPSFVQLAAGGSHTCGLTGTGTAYCWGSNGRGQLGDGTTEMRREAVAVPALRFTSLAAGAAMTCGTVIGGGTYCWGDNAVGQLGNGGLGGMAATPQRVRPEEGFGRVAAGGSHGCGLVGTGAAACWGMNTSGQLGNLEVRDWWPFATRVWGQYSYAVIAAGEQHTCAITSDTWVHCWGENGSGQLGDGTTENRVVPTAVVGTRLQ
ncbi:MAG TPA: hypothetical protein VE871_17515 [Longimicrobium sp.]|nr:hypothetical protein [Longimicrobium sp.]